MLQHLLKSAVTWYFLNCFIMKYYTSFCLPTRLLKQTLKIGKIYELFFWTYHIGCKIVTENIFRLSTKCARWHACIQNYCVHQLDQMHYFVRNIITCVQKCYIDLILTDILNVGPNNSTYFQYWYISIIFPITDTLHKVGCGGLVQLESKVQGFPVYDLLRFKACKSFFLFSLPVCCVFRPAFGCCAHHT